MCVEATAPAEPVEPPAEPAAPADLLALVPFEPERCAGFVVLAPWVLVPWVSDWCEAELGVVVDVLARCVVAL